MIHVTRLNQSSIVLNCDLIEHIESTPDTVITLVNNQKLTVLETADEILDYFESCPVPKANPKMRAAMLEGRSRQSREKSNRRGARP